MFYFINFFLGIFVPKGPSDLDWIFRISQLHIGNLFKFVLEIMVYEDTNQFYYFGDQACYQVRASNIFLTFILQFFKQISRNMPINSQRCSLSLVYQNMLEKFKFMVLCNSQLQFLLGQVAPSNRKIFEKRAITLKKKVQSCSISSSPFVKQWRGCKENLSSAYQLSIIKSLRKRLSDLYDLLSPEQITRKALLECYSDTIEIIIESGQDDDLSKFMILDDWTIEKSPLIIDNLFSNGNNITGDQLNEDDRFQSYSKYPIILRYFVGIMLLIAQQFAEKFAAFQSLIAGMNSSHKKFRIRCQSRGESRRKNENKQNKQASMHPSKAGQILPQNASQPNNQISQFLVQNS